MATLRCATLAEEMPTGPFVLWGGLSHRERTRHRLDTKAKHCTCFHFLLPKIHKTKKKTLKSPNGTNIQKMHFFGALLFSATFSPSAPNTGTLLSVALPTLSLCILPLACIGCVVQWLDTANSCPGHYPMESRPLGARLWSFNFHWSSWLVHSFGEGVYKCHTRRAGLLVGYQAT